jgi:alpha-D-xyloside xylohydrolase
VSGNGLSFSDGGKPLLTNSLFTGTSNGALSPVPLSNSKRATTSKAQWSQVSENVVRIDVEGADPESVTSAAFSFVANDTFYGVWEYPWNGTITNQNLDFEVKGLFGDQPGVNYANARAPFFFTKSGFGVYVDTLQMGRFHFSGTTANFTFNTPVVSYRVLFNKDLKALLMQYANLSSKPQLPPDSGYGPIFWSDNMKEDFHGAVNNSQENYYDIHYHLNSSQIRATAMFADRK